MPSKATNMQYPASRVAMSPPEYPDSSTTYSSRHSRKSGGSYSSVSTSSRYSDDYDTPYRPDSSHDIMDNLSERMNSAFDPITMDRALATQAKE
jgi:hypothetical protein